MSIKMNSILNPKEKLELKIFKQDQFCGLLKRMPSGGTEFCFDRDYLKNPTTKDLSFNLQKREEPYRQEGINLHPFFAGLLPEGLRLKFLQNQIKTSQDDLFSLFAAMGGDCIGDVHSEAFKVSISDYEQPAWNSVSFQEFFFEVLKKEGVKEVQSIPGVQEKISTSMISLPIHFNNSKNSYILKLAPKDKPNLVYNEWACLSLAQACGIEVNDFFLIADVDNNLGLLVKRFDRYFDSTKNKIASLHQEDMCQILNSYPAEKYRIPLKDIFLAIIKFSSAPLIDTIKTLRLVLFSYLIGNGDLHAKNISLYESPNDGRISLTPAYDLVCTLIYGDQKMALKMDGKDSQFGRKDFITFGCRFGLSLKSIESMIDDLLNLFFLHQHILFSIDMPDNRMNFLAKEIENKLNKLS